MKQADTMAEIARSTELDEAEGDSLVILWITSLSYSFLEERRAAEQLKLHSLETAILGLQTKNKELQAALDSSNESMYANLFEFRFIVQLALEQLKSKLPESSVVDNLRSEVTDLRKKLAASKSTKIDISVGFG